MQMSLTDVGGNEEATWTGRESQVDLKYRML